MGEVMVVPEVEVQMEWGMARWQEKMVPGLGLGQVLETGGLGRRWLRGSRQCEESSRQRLRGGTLGRPDGNRWESG